MDDINQISKYVFIVLFQFDCDYVRQDCAWALVA